MPGLFLECKSCGKSFPSRIGVNDDAIHGVSMNGVMHRCPNCQHEAEYFTADYFVPNATGQREKAPPVQPEVPHESQAQLEARRLSGYSVSS
jgi:hypothetical protein